MQRKRVNYGDVALFFILLLRTCFNWLMLFFVHPGGIFANELINPPFQLLSKRFGNTDEDEETDAISNVMK